MNRLDMCNVVIWTQESLPYAIEGVNVIDIVPEAHYMNYLGYYQLKYDPIAVHVCYVTEFKTKFPGYGVE